MDEMEEEASCRTSEALGSTGMGTEAKLLPDSEDRSVGTVNCGGLKEEADDDWDRRLLSPCPDGIRLRMSLAEISALDSVSKNTKVVFVLVSTLAFISPAPGMARNSSRGPLDVERGFDQERSFSKSFQSPSEKQYCTVLWVCMMCNEHVSYHNQLISYLHCPELVPSTYLQNFRK